MSIASECTDWQRSHAGDGLPQRCSPNLTEISDYLRPKFDLSNLGCFTVRPIRGSTSIPSSHSYGAALDLGFNAPQYDDIRDRVCPWLVAWSAELGIGAIHDYRGCRIWHAGRNANESDACTAWWKAQRPNVANGMGQSWANHLHLEVIRSAWDRGDAVSTRGVD